MVPAQVHMHLESAVSAGTPFSVTRLEPGDHGPVVAGTQGCGVSVPMAAEVAAATCGFASDWHIPKGPILVMGTVSAIVAAGFSSASEPTVGSTASETGAMPWLHFNCAPFTTSFGMVSPSSAPGPRWSAPGR